MTDDRDRNDGGRTWRNLVAAAQRAPRETEPPAAEDRAERVAAAWRTRRQVVRAKLGDERIVGWAALFAVAASLAVMFAGWDDLAALAGRSSGPFETPITVEPLP